MVYNRISPPHLGHSNGSHPKVSFMLSRQLFAEICFDFNLPNFSSVSFNFSLLLAPYNPKYSIIRNLLSGMCLSNLLTNISKSIFTIRSFNLLSSLKFSFSSYQNRTYSSVNSTSLHSPIAGRLAYLPIWATARKSAKKRLQHLVA